MVVSSPAVADNHVYVGSYNNMLYAFGSPSNTTSVHTDTQVKIVVSLVVAIVIAATILLAAWFLRKKK